MRLVPVKRQSLAAARGTTSFEGLFLGFSFFLMASAVMLIILLFRLGAEGRAAELGVLAGVGIGPSRVGRLWLAEAAVIALLGASVGIVLGIGYAQLMIHGLTTWWVAATVTPFLELHVAGDSLVVGLLVGAAVSLVAMFWSLRRLLHLPVRQLLTGDRSRRPQSHWSKSQRRFVRSRRRSRELG